MKYIYVLNSCNAWKEYNSMNIEMVTTSWKKLYKKVLKLIKENKLEIGNDSLLESCKNFPDDYEFINNIINEIYIERYED